MKRRISDMLDSYSDDTLEFSGSAPLSSERIKEITMSKITKKEKKNKRIAFRVLVAAAIIASLTMTAFAAEEIFGAGDWFRDIFNAQLEEDKLYVEKNEMDVTVRETVSEGQAAVVDELGQSFQSQTQTSEGTTVTLAAAYADQNVIHLYVQVEAPAGTVLPDDIIYTFYDYNNDFDEDGHWYVLTLPEDAPYKMAGHSQDIEALPDDDPTDNKKNFHVTIIIQNGMEMKFNDGISKFFNMTGIYQQVPNVDGDEDGFEQLASGKFSFDIGMANAVEWMELEVEGMTYGGDVTETWTHDSECQPLCGENLTGESDPETGLPIHSESYTYSVTAESLTISPLSAEWACTFTCSDTQHSFGLEFGVVLKDGTTVLTLPGLGGSYGDDWSCGTVYFSQPLDISEIDYILLGDPDINSTYKIYLPE